ncbi:hypothetical protein GBAR_LOCUS5339, partial [Geodia barretti]
SLFFAPQPLQQGTSPGPLTSGNGGGGDDVKKSGDPVYETITGLTLPPCSHQSSSSSSSSPSSSPSSPLEEKETTRLIPQPQVAPDLPPRSAHMISRVNRPASSRNGSRYSMIEGGATSSPALLPRPQSAHITLFPTTGSGTTGALTRDSLETSGKNGSLPLLAFTQNV